MASGRVSGNGVRAVAGDASISRRKHYDQADQYQISVYVDVSCYDVREKKVLWEEKRLKGYGIYSATAQREVARREGLGAAFQILTRDIVDRAQVGGW